MENDGRYLIQPRGYNPQDVASCAELMRTLDKAGEAGLTISDLYQALQQQQEDPQCGRTRTMQQYMEVNAHTADWTEFPSM